MEELCEQEPLEFKKTFSGRKKMVRLPRESVFDIIRTFEAETPSEKVPDRKEV